MSKHYLPNKDSELVLWSAHFSSAIDANPGAVGLVAGQSAAYATAQSQFAAALNAASNPETRTRGTVIGKNDAKKALIALTRELVRIIQAYPPVTNEQRADLGITVRDVEPSPVNPPTEPPVMEVGLAIGRILRMKLRSVDSSRRGKPDGVAGATVLSYVGEEPPADISEWKFEGSTTRTNFEVEFPPTVPAGSRVWLTALWFSPRAQVGPACLPVSAYIAGGVIQSQAA